MELILLASGLNTLLPRLWEHRRDQRKKKLAIDLNLKAIKNLMSTRLVPAIEDPKFMGDGSPSALNLKRRARILSQNTLDCIQLFFKDKNASNTEFEEKTRDHRKAIEDLCGKLEDYTPQEKATKKPEDPCATNHMAMDETVEEVMKLIELPGDTDRGRKVISIVGFPGLGKTTIAELVYDSKALKNRHPCTVRARVTAAAKDATEVLTEILNQVDAHGDHERLRSEKLSLAKPILEKRNREKVGELLKQRLLGERYFIVIDDMQSIEQWGNMKYAFPEDEHGSGTIIVTTSIQSVANVCSPFKGYVYNLSALDEHKSLDLFMKDRGSWRRDSANKNASDILKKCDGLPLAIVTMSEILKGTPTGVPTFEECRTACAELGTYLLEGGDGLGRLRWVLMNKYTGLTCDALRSCLLYYCLYKHNMDAVPRRNSLMRRWEAEGFLVPKNETRTAKEIAAKNINILVDRNIMQSMEVGTNGRTRRCRPHGMMLEYISSISMSEKFAASVRVSDAVPSGIRRLSFYPGSARDVKRMSDEDLKLVLTLEVSGIGWEAIPDFKKYELIAVMELKECPNLKPRHVEDICKLVLLKYLSLGNSIGEIPRAIGGLTQLETLEMRRDKTVLVHEELLELPNLKNLLGKFQLVKKSDEKLENFLSGKSGIETVTGFVTYTARGFPKLMHHMKRLRKMKIYCTPTATDEDQKDLQREIKAFTREGTNDRSVDRSLSVDFAEFTPGLQQSIVSPLEFLKVAGSVDSLKLRGDWRPLLSYDGGWRPFISVDDGHNIPDLTMITAITKLCLAGTHLSGEDVLAGLTRLTALGYLKLEEEELGPLEIKSHTFKQLTRLCLVGKRKLHGITIEPKALPSLLSLHLICEALDPGLESSIQSGGVQRLNEIAMDSQVATGIRGAWKRAAEGHPNRPQVLLIKKGAPIRQA